MRPAITLPPGSSNPVNAGAYVYGKTRTEMALDASGVRRKRIRHLPRHQWQVLIKERDIIEASLTGRPMRPTSSASQGTRGGYRTTQGGAVREGARSCRALRAAVIAAVGCDGIIAVATCAPGYHCAGEHLVEGVAAIA